MLVDPRRLFVYWVLDTDHRLSLASARGPAEIRLEGSSDGVTFHETSRHPFDFRAPSWYVPNSGDDRLVRARLGMAAGASFRTLLLSNTLIVPRRTAGAAPSLFHGRERPAAAGWPGFSPGVHAWEASAPRRASNIAPPIPEARGYLTLVLHAHLPFVRHPERDYFLEEQWLFEAITETYLPILDMLDHLLEDGVPIRITLSLTATLAGMLRDPVLVAKYVRHLDRMCELADREVARTRRDVDFSPVAGFYRDRLERQRFLFTKTYGRDLVGRFAALEEAGIVELIGCAATHGFLPHLAVSPEAVRAQIAVGVAEHRRQIGRPPRGFWIPECAYFEGLDEILTRAGIEYCFLDAHAMRNASSRPRFDVHAPIATPAGVAVFARDEESSSQVWSSIEGYPGDPSYRDFYRDIGYDLEHSYVAPYLDPSGLRGMTGLKYHRITGRTDDKQPYRRDDALRTAARHAQDFVANRRAQATSLQAGLDRKPLLVAMYDAELFGHWWFEGPEWLESVLRILAGQGLRAISAGQYLEEHPTSQVAEPSASSWGAGGYFDVWLNETNDWIVPPLHDAARRMIDLASREEAPVGSRERRALAQAGRELLLAQASDWPFILKNWTSVDYARQRVREHLHRFDLLARQIESGSIDEDTLGALEARDNLFPGLDPGVWRRP
jgi:1,4-alpha-glucan branching enzyme